MRLIQVDSPQQMLINAIQKSRCRLEEIKGNIEAAQLVVHDSTEEQTEIEAAILQYEIAIAKLEV